LLSKERNIHYQVSVQVIYWHLIIIYLYFFLDEKYPKSSS